MIEDDIRRIVRDEIAKAKQSEERHNQDDGILKKLRDAYEKAGQRFPDPLIQLPPPNNPHPFPSYPYYRDVYGQYRYAPPREVTPYYSPYRYTMTTGELGVR